MGFADQLKAFGDKTETNLNAVYEGVDQATFDSIVEGSPITGAPGQPIGFTGKLHDSWSMEKAVGETTISSTDGAALAVEENWSNGVFKNHGPKSLALTVANFDLIVKSEVAKVVG